MVETQLPIDFDLLTKTIEQRIALGSQFDGAIPSLSSLAVGQRDFVSFYDPADGVFRMKNPGPLTTPGSVSQGDHGGLFTFTHKKGIWLSQFFADLGSSIAWTLALVTSTGDEIQITGATSRYVVLHFFQYATLINPGEKLKFVTSGATAAMVARAYLSLEVPGLP
jgi:hypothetical protein